MLVAGLSGWYTSHTLLLDLMMSSAVGAMSYQVALRSGIFAFIGAGFWGVGAYAAGDIAVKTHYPWILGVVIGIAIAALGGLLLSVLFIRLSGLYLGMATFAFDLVMGVVAQNGGRVTGGAAGLAPIPNVLSVPEMFGIFVLICALVSRLEVGRLGRAQELLRADPELAIALGLRTRAWRHWVFVIAAALGSVSGSLYALTFFSVSPSQLGFATLIGGVATVVIGGIASWRGCVIGAIIVIGVPDLFNGLQLWEPVIYGGLLVLAAVAMPEGLFGLWPIIRERLRAYRARVRGEGNGEETTPLEPRPAGWGSGG